MRWTIFFIAAALVALALAPALHQPLLSLPVLAFFSRVCHQDPARSLWVAGVPMAVCARCFGIYTGALAGSLVRVNRQVALRLLAVAASTNLLDVLAEAAGLHGNWAVVRLCLGCLLGTAMTLMMSAKSADLANPIELSS